MRKRDSGTRNFLDLRVMRPTRVGFGNAASEYCVEDDGVHCQVATRDKFRYKREQLYRMAWILLIVTPLESSNPGLGEEPNRPRLARQLKAASSLSFIHCHRHLLSFLTLVGLAMSFGILSHRPSSF